MCTDVPVPFMQEQKTILGVPEIRGMSRQEFTIGVPIVEMKLQTWKVRIPEFTLKNVRGEVRKIQERATEMQEREKNANAALSNAMQAEIKQVSTDQTNNLFGCQEGEIRAQMASALAQIDANMNAMRESIKSAAAFGASELEASMRKGVEELIAAREKTLASFEETLTTLAAQKREALAKILAET